MRPRRPRARPDLPDEAVAWLRGEDGGAWVYGEAPDDLASLWAECRHAIVAEHVAEHPGTRPLRWWQYDAPEPRRRLGGIGTPCHEVLAHGLRLHLGIPADWITDWQVKFYTGKAIDIRGRPIGQEYVGRKFRGVAIDPRNPPTFESQATYLKRPSLFLTGEERRLRPADFEPQDVLTALGWSEAE